MLIPPLTATQDLLLMFSIVRRDQAGSVPTLGFTENILYRCTMIRPDKIIIVSSMFMLKIVVIFRCSYTSGIILGCSYSFDRFRVFRVWLFSITIPKICALNFELLFILPAY